MNRTEWLLTQLASEASEVAHAATKALQFGLDDDYPGYGTPRQRILDEYNDLVGVMMKLHEVGILMFPSLQVQTGAVRNKMEKVEKMYEYAVKIGAVR